MSKKTSSDRYEIVDLITQNKDSKYWKILSEKMNEWIETEEKYMSSFKTIGMNETDIKKFNESALKIRCLRQVLKINDVILQENLSILQKLKIELESTKFYQSLFKKDGLFESLKR